MTQGELATTVWGFRTPGDPLQLTSYSLQIQGELEYQGVKYDPLKSCEA
jgi:hypothetical protein